MIQKIYLAAISVCLTDVAIFTGDILRDAIKIMLDDEMMPVALVRTALLASKAHMEVKRFVLSDVIPILIRKKIWLTTPIHWEGLRHCVKNYAVPTTTTAQNQSLIEPTLRSILGLPGKELKSIITVAPLIKPSLTKLLKVLSPNEKEDVISGRWAGLDTESNSGEVAVLDTEKSTIIAGLLA